MSDVDKPLQWEQYFPTYTFRERDIALLEYSAAARTLESEERLFLNASNIAIVVGAALGSLALGALNNLLKSFEDVLDPMWVLISIILATLIFSIISVKYFADRQKAVVFSARKVIVLRRMLGLSYGNIRMVLPNWRIEGADEPFAIHSFPGWARYACYPFYIILLVSTAVLFFIVPKFLKYFSLTSHWYQDVARTTATNEFFLISTLGAWVLALAYIYRVALCDYHENALLIFTRQLAKILWLRLEKNFEYVIYRAVLATHEAQRLEISLPNLKSAALFLEDRQFFHHFGISLRGIGRAIFQYIKRGKRAGGSTITQQLARSLFIKFPAPIIRRKITEILLAFWLETVLEKNAILEIYLVSAKYEHGVYGIAAAMRHFFGKILQTPSKAEAFFLVERISNSRSKFLGHKIKLNLLAAIKAKIMAPEDAREALDLYTKALHNGKITAIEGLSIEEVKVAIEQKNE